MVTIKKQKKRTDEWMNGAGEKIKLHPNYRKSRKNLTKSEPYAYGEKALGIETMRNAKQESRTYRKVDGGTIKAASAGSNKQTVKNAASKPNASKAVVKQKSKNGNGYEMKNARKTAKKNKKPFH